MSVKEKHSASGRIFFKVKNTTLKISFLFIASLLFAVAGKSQYLVFNIDQSGQAYKNVKTGMFDDAEVRDTNATIVLQNDKLVVNDSKKISYALMQKTAGKKSSKPVITRIWNGLDEEKHPVVLKMTVNVESKMAVIEVAYSKCKNYYFGTCTSAVD